MIGNLLSYEMRQNCNLELEKYEKHNDVPACLRQNWHACLTGIA